MSWLLICSVLNNQFIHWHEDWGIPMLVGRDYKEETSGENLAEWPHLTLFFIAACTLWRTRVHICDSLFRTLHLKVGRRVEGAYVLVHSTVKCVQSTLVNLDCFVPDIPCRISEVIEVTRFRTNTFFTSKLRGQSEWQKVCSVNVPIKQGHANITYYP